MFNIVLNDMSIEPKNLDALDRQAGLEITIRGYEIEKVAVPPELRRKELFLPINAIVSGYCPTDRYLYLTKIDKTAKAEPTWDSFKGKIIDELYGELFDTLSSYVAVANIRNLQVRETLETFKTNQQQKVQKLYDENKGNLMNPPTQKEFDDFLNGVNKIIRYETQLCSAILDFKVSMKKDIRLKSEFALLFPFIPKPKISAPELGFTEGQEPDFIYGKRVICDVKTGPMHDFFYLTLAAYALAYENETKKPMNLGLIINPQLEGNRRVPLYSTEVVVLDDRLRKIVRTLRDKKLEFMKNAKDPSKPKDDNKLCASCGFHNKLCWSGKNVGD